MYGRLGDWEGGWTKQVPFWSDPKPSYSLKIQEISLYFFSTIVKNSKVLGNVRNFSKYEFFNIFFLTTEQLLGGPKTIRVIY